MPSMRNLQQAVVSNANTGQTTLINNARNSFLYVWDAYITLATSTNLVFYDGGTALTGNMNFLAGGVFDQSGISPFPMWTISPNSNLSVTSSAAAQQSGWITYSY